MAETFTLDVGDGFKNFAADALKKLDAEFPSKLLEAGVELQSELILSTSSILKKHSQGTLKRGWRVSPVRTGAGGLEVDVTNEVPYALIHEEGGVIRPKRVKALAVPNRSYRPIIKNGAPISPRDFDPGRTILKFYPAIIPGRLRGYLVDKDTGQLAYTLMASVTIKPTGYITKAIETATPRIVELVGSAFITALGRSG